MPAQDKLSFNEQIMAYVAGAGIALAIVALFLIGVGSASDNLSISLLIVGLALVVLGVAGWLYFVRPWKNFDDLKTPHFTGHEEHAAAEPVTALAAPEVVVHTPTELAAAEPVIAAVETAPAAAAARAESVVAAVETAPAAAAEVPPAKPKMAAPAAKKAAPAEPVIAAVETAPAAAAEVPPAEPKMAAPVSRKTAPAKPKVAAPAAEKAAAAPAQPDELTLLEGIGPKSAAALNTAGITTFSQIAAKTPEELEALIKEQKVRLVGSTATWPAQARLAAAGEVTALEDFKKRIKSGGKTYDDLTTIEGIGPKVQQALYQAGILTFGDLAASTTGQLREILAGGGLQKVNVDRWPEQAGLAAGRDLTGLKKLQDEL